MSYDPGPDALETVRQRLEGMSAAYRLYMNLGAHDIPSAGTVARYGEGGGGRTNRTSDFTATLGLRLASVPPSQALNLRWIDCAWRVFMRGTSANLNAHDYSSSRRGTLAAISYVLYYRALLGYSLTKIADMPMPHGGRVSRQRVGQYWKLAIAEVAAEAARMGLI